MKTYLRRPLALASAATCVLAFAAGLAWAAIPNGNVIDACFDTSTGALRAVGVSTDCAAGTEAAVALGGPTRGYSASRPAEIMLAATSTPVATLVLPEGSYQLHGKVNVANLNFRAIGTTFVPCSLLVETTALDQSWVQLMQAVTGTGANTTTIALQAPLTVPAGGKATVNLACASIPRPGGPATNVFARYRQLSAVQVDALQLQ